MRALADTTTSQRVSLPAVDIAAAALLALACAVYLVRATALAAAAPLWMDEVLAVWTASQPSVGAVWSALVHGAEFSPPAFDLLLHGLRALGLTSPLAMRAPSILALAVAAAGVFTIVRRHAAMPIAAVACAAVLSGGAFAYAVQARPYACSTAALTWAVVLWERYPPAPKQDRGAAFIIGSLCALAVAFQFYAVIVVGLLALAELVFAASRRKLRLPLLAAIALGAASILCWWPIARAASAFNAGDVVASAFYARPTWGRLLSSYASLSLPLAPAFLVVAVALLFRDEAPGRPTPWPSGAGRETTLIGVVAYAVPAVVFVFARLVTHAFSERYVIVAALGCAVLLARLLGALANRAGLVAVGLLGLLTLMTPFGGQIAAPGRAETIALVRAAPFDLPIVTGDGLRFFELSADPIVAGADRLVYLHLDDATAGGDPTNRHQVERWAALKPSVRVVDATTFVCETPRFLLLHDPAGGPDELPAWLDKVATVRWLQQIGRGLALVTAPACPKRADKGSL